VDGNYFDVVGLRPVSDVSWPAGRRCKSRCVVVLTYRFWSTVYKSDPASLVRTFVSAGALAIDLPQSLASSNRPSLSGGYGTYRQHCHSPHHLSATMQNGRVHRMTELFGRLAPGATLDQTRAELRTVYAAMMKDHADAYSPQAHFQVDAKLLREQITSGARTVLLVLLAASGLVFIIACSNVANLILARSVRREANSLSARLWARARARCAALCWRRVLFFASRAPLSV